jgi:hypothetical protein
MPILWGATPPPKLPKAYIRLLVVKPREEVTVCLLGKVMGIICHFVDGRSIACTGEQECVVHDRKGEWKGFAAGAIFQGTRSGPYGNWRETVLCLTRNCGEFVDACTLGSFLTLRRIGNSPRAALEATKSDRKLPPCPLSNFDPKPYVMRAMGWPNESACKLFRGEVG